MNAGTGKRDKNGVEMIVGDIVHFRADGISGTGIVYLERKPDGLSENDNFRIKDVRPGKNFLRTYPYYQDAIYRIDSEEAIDEKKVDIFLKMASDKETKLHGSSNSGNYLIPLTRVIEILQEV